MIEDPSNVTAQNIGMHAASLHGQMARDVMEQAQFEGWSKEKVDQYMRDIERYRTQIREIKGGPDDSDIAEEFSGPATGLDKQTIQERLDLLEYPPDPEDVRHSRADLQSDLETPSFAPGTTEKI